jgi:RNA polymerase sigma factor (sigma-70 family)
MRPWDESTESGVSNSLTGKKFSLVAPSPVWGDEHLVKACLDGNEDAWSALISKYKRMIYSVPVRYGASPQDAADIFQQVCVELFSKLGDLRKVESLRSWLLTVASHQSLRWKKMRHLNDLELDDVDEDHAPIEIADGGQLAPDQMIQIEMEQTLREIIRKLPQRCYTMVQLLFYGEEALPYAEVARRLGLATGSIGFIRGRCLTRLRKLLDEAGFR